MIYRNNIRHYCDCTGEYWRQHDDNSSNISPLYYVKVTFAAAIQMQVIGVMVPIECRLPSLIMSDSSAEPSRTRTTPKYRPFPQIFRPITAIPGPTAAIPCMLSYKTVHVKPHENGILRLTFRNMYDNITIITKPYTVQTDAPIRKEGVYMPNQSENVQPLKSAHEIAEFRSALRMNKRNGRRNDMIFLFGINTGLRASDLVGITVADVAGRSKFEITERKTGKRRTIVIASIMPELADYIESLPTDAVYLFPSATGKPMSVTQLYRILNDAADLLGRNDIGTHTLRKTYGYFVYQATKDVRFLMDVFGHASQSITLRYIGIDAERMERTLSGIRIG